MGDDLLIEALGVCVPIDLADAEVEAVEAVHAAWGDALVAERVGEQRVTEPARLGSDDLPTALSRLSSEVTLRAIAARRGELWMLHAAALALPDGRVIVLVGPSGRGKTTASRVLGAHLGYVSDETAGIALDGTVLPYRKPLSVIETLGAPKAQLAATQAGLGPLPDAPLRLARIVLLDRRDDAPRHPLIEQVPFAEAVGELVEQTSYLALMPRALHTLHEHVRRTGGVVRASYREVSTLLPLLDDLVNGAMSHEPEMDAALTAAETLSAVSRNASLFERVDPLDVLDFADPDRSVLLHRSRGEGGATVHVLAGIGPAVWRAADGVGFDEIVNRVLSEVGEPPEGDGRARIRAVVDDLVAAGVLRDNTAE